MAEGFETQKNRTESAEKLSIPNSYDAEKNPLQEHVENIDQRNSMSRYVRNEVIDDNYKKKKKKKTKLVKPPSNNDDSKTLNKGSKTSLMTDNVLSVLNEHQKIICRQHHVTLKVPSFQCELCVYICRSWSHVEQHVSTSSHISALEDSNDTMSVKLLPTALPKQKELLGQMIKGIILELGMNKTSQRKAIVKRIHQSISEQFRGCSAKVYGSSLYLAGLATSDVNINITIPSSLNFPSTMMAIFEHLKEDEANRNVKFKMSTSITSILLEDVSSELPCCITFNNNLSCEVAQVLLTYLSLDERAMQLATGFRCWAHLCCLDQIDYGTLPAHAFPILVIYFLQQLEVPVLPVLGHHDLRKEDPAFQETFGPHRSDINWKTRNRMSVGELWLELFKFYVLDFDGGRVVSIRSKEPVYQSSKRWSRKKFGIEDPVAHDKNIAKTFVNLYSLNYFIHCLRTSAMYFATPQLQGFPIFRRVQLLPPGMENLTHLLKEREQFLAYIFKNHPFFLIEQEVKERNPHQLINPADPNFKNIGQFIVTPEQAQIMFKNINPAYLFYEFHVKHFNGGQVRPVICIFCYEEGHYKDKCPCDSLPPLEKLPDLQESFLNNLSEMCEAIYYTWSLTPSEVAAREEIVSHLLTFLNKRFPDIALTLFGSSCNGFGLKRSDIDICFTFTTCPPGEVPDLDFGKLIQDLYGLLKSYSPLTNLVPITTAKVPILKFLHVKTELDGDISFHNTLALKNTKLIWAYSCIDKRAKVLGYVVKRFAKVSRICDASKGSLSSYAYILMMIHFLQQCHPPVLPVLQELCRPSSTEEFTLENCDVYFFEDLEKLPTVWPDYGKNTKSIGELWIQFLCYYTEIFDFSECVVTIRRKKPLTKFEKLWHAKSLAIEDPFDVEHNLGIGLRLKMHHYILKAFINGRSYFSKECNMPNCEPLSVRAENYFEGSKVKGSPPDRGCHYCKRIGHIMKDCPERQQRKDNDWPKERQRDRFPQSPKTARPYKNLMKGNSNLEENLLQDTSRASFEKGKRTTWWNQRVPPTARPVVPYTTNPHWSGRPIPLTHVKLPPEMETRVQALAQKWHIGSGNQQVLPQKDRVVDNVQTRQKPPGKIFDVYSRPSEPGVSGIPSLEFYNKTAQKPSKFQG